MIKDLRYNIIEEYCKKNINLDSILNTAYDRTFNDEIDSLGYQKVKRLNSNE